MGGGQQLAWQDMTWFNSVGSWFMGFRSVAKDLPILFRNPCFVRRASPSFYYIYSFGKRSMFVFSPCFSGNLNLSCCVTAIWELDPFKTSEWSTIGTFSSLAFIIFCLIVQAQTWKGAALWRYVQIVRRAYNYFL